MTGIIDSEVIATAGSSEGNTKIIKTCGRISCSKAANLACSRSRCRLCCVIEGGCTAAQKHTLSSLSDNQRRKVLDAQPSQLPPPSAPLRNAGSATQPESESFSDGMRALAARLDEDNPTVQLQKACLRQQQQERQAQLEEERIEREEEEEHQALLAATRASLREADELLLSPTPTASQSFTVSGLPVTRATTSNRPTITTQMNSTWMRDFEDRTQVPLALAKGGKNKIDKAMVHRFRIILWLEVHYLFASNLTGLI